MRPRGYVEGTCGPDGVRLVERTPFAWPTALYTANRTNSSAKVNVSLGVEGLTGNLGIRLRMTTDVGKYQ